MIWRLFLTGLAAALWSAVLLAVAVVNSLPGTEADRAIWTANPLLWWGLLGCGPVIILAGAWWASRARR